MSSDQHADTARAERLLRQIMNDPDLCWMNEQTADGRRMIVLEVTWLVIEPDDAAYLESLRLIDGGIDG